MALGFAVRAMSLTALSRAAMFVACPAPIPVVLVGVLTLRRIMSASAIASAISVEKNKLGSRMGLFDADPGEAPGFMLVARKPSRAARTTS
jgi:hypothetical protein